MVKLSSMETLKIVRTDRYPKQKLKYFEQFVAVDRY